ncbi:MAG: hypothetical protein OXC18_19345 [Desulfurellaceae bacterium]|nr:hypothetical protein [Desulfurellaceae bacterium]
MLSAFLGELVTSQGWNQGEHRSDYSANERLTSYLGRSVEEAQQLREAGVLFEKNL